MFVEEADAKALIAAAGIAVPPGSVASTADEARSAAQAIGRPAMVKAQVPAGKRGKAGGVVAVDTPDQAFDAAVQMLGSRLGDHDVERVLVEGRADIAAELYVAIMADPTSAGPLLMVSAQGGVDIEEVHATDPDAVVMHAIDIQIGLDARSAAEVAGSVIAGPAQVELAGLLLTLYGVFRSIDAQLVELNPVAVTSDERVIALDAKLVIDDNALFRQEALPEQRPTGTDLERRAAEQDFSFVELDGDVGVLANGAGLTISTMDAVNALGGRPANFLEVGGMAYKRAAPALELVLSNPKVNSLLVNLCGAYARTDVIAEGLIAGFEQLSPDIGVSFCIHGTGEERAKQLVRDQLGVEPHDLMDDAVTEAIRMAAGS